MSILNHTELILNPDGSIYHLNLLPGDIADNIILVGDPDRVDIISSFFDSVKNKKMTNGNLDKNEFLELEILNHVEDSPKLTTRMIATHLGCNLRLTHALLKKLIGKGMLNVKKINSRNWHYYLTPKGISEKANKTYKFFEFSMQFYQQAREKSGTLCRRLATQGKNNVAFYGCGYLAEITYLSVQENKLKLVEVYGDSKKEFMGQKVMSFDGIDDSQADSIIICVYDKTHPVVKKIIDLDLSQVEWIF